MEGALWVLQVVILCRILRDLSEDEQSQEAVHTMLTASCEQSQEAMLHSADAEPSAALDAARYNAPFRAWIATKLHEHHFFNFSCIL